MIKEAINIVLENYKNDREPNLRLHEYGYLFWRNGTTLEPGERIDSTNTNSVNLYPESVRLEILSQVLLKKEKEYVGEFHAHPKGNGTWAGQLPSPDDIVNCHISVAGSKWPINYKNLEDLDISPEFQIIQSLLWGDLIVLQRGSAWKPFNDLDEQKKKLKKISLRYSKWHKDADGRLGKVENRDHTSFYKIWSKETGSIGKILGDRFDVRSIPNN